MLFYRLLRAFLSLVSYIEGETTSKTKLDIASPIMDFLFSSGWQIKRRELPLFVSEEDASQLPSYLN